MKEKTHLTCGQKKPAIEGNGGYFILSECNEIRRCNTCQTQRDA